MNVSVSRGFYGNVLVTCVRLCLSCDGASRTLNVESERVDVYGFTVAYIAAVAAGLYCAVLCVWVRALGEMRNLEYVEVKSSSNLGGVRVR